jgi:hypothetical protein
MCVVQAGSLCTVWVQGEECTDDPCAGVAKCSEGLCAHEETTAVTCPTHDEVCWLNVCDSVSGECKETAAEEGVDCQGPDLCVGGESCDGAGACVGGKSDQCSCPENPCPLWPDANLCNGVYVCDGGFCVYGADPVLCEEHPSECLSTTCNEETGACVDGPENEGGPCDDGVKCTVASECAAGACVATASLACDLGPCTVSECAEETGECVLTEDLAPCCGNGESEALEACDGTEACDGDCVFATCAGKAIAIQGDGCVTTQAAVLLPGESDWTVELYVRLDGTIHDGTLLAMQGDAGEASALVISASVVSTNSAEVAVTFIDSVGAVTELEAVAALTKQWVHVAVTFAHDASGSTLTSWMNGELAGYKGVGGAIDEGAAHELSIGCSNPGAYIQGRFDEVRVSSIVRYDGGFSAPNAPFEVDDDTTLLYAFDELEPGLAVDQSTGGHHGAWNKVELHAHDPFSVGDPTSCSTAPCLRHSLAFDGSQGPSPASTVGYTGATQNLVLAMDVRVDGLDGEQAIVGQAGQDPLSSGWSFTARVINGNVQFRWHERQGLIGNPSLTFYSTTTAVIAPEQWVHIVVKRQYSDGEGQLVFVVDGVTDQSWPMELPLPLEVGGVPLEIGALSDGTQPLVGGLDSLHIMDGSAGLEDALNQPLAVPAATWQTVALYGADVGFGPEIYSKLPALLGPIEISNGVTFSTDQASWLEPCPTP